MNIRWITEEELTWVNETYASIDFAPSHKDHVAIAHIAEHRAGLGRLVPLAQGGHELGGIYVLPTYRKKGIARELVTFLLNNAPSGPIYCLPFEELQNFYTSFGFKPCTIVPEEISKKHTWCLQTYHQNVLTMKKLKK